MIIAIDGASTDLSIALAAPDGASLDDDRWTSRQRQSAELLPRIGTLLDRNGMALDAVTALAVGTGPGSFTGLRVALALAKGLAFALHRPIVGVPSLQSWLDVEPEASAAVARAGAREAYVLIRGESDPTIVDRDAFPEALAGARIVAPTELAEAFGLESAVSPRGAVGIARSAAVRLAAAPDGDDLRDLEPLYLRAPRGVTAQSEARVRWL